MSYIPQPTTPTPIASSVAPLIVGATGVVGTSSAYARADHVHPGTLADFPSGAVVTTGATAAFTGGQTVLVVRKGTGSATAITLPAAPVNWVPYQVKDGKGDAATNNITVSPASGTVDGAASAVLNINFQGLTFVYDGTSWNLV